MEQHSLLGIVLTLSVVISLVALITMLFRDIARMRDALDDNDRCYCIYCDREIDDYNGWCHGCLTYSAKPRKR